MTFWNDDEIRAIEIEKEKGKESYKLIRFINKFWSYAKGRGMVTIYTFLLSSLFIDILHFKYWQFAIWFIPLNFFANFFIYEYIFIGKPKKEQEKKAIS